MSSYIHFTQAQKEQAKNTDLVSLLQSQGEKLKRSGSEFQWRSGADKVTIRGNKWFHQYEHVGGDAIAFVRRFYNKNYPEAVEMLLGGKYGTLCNQDHHVFDKPKKPFALPPSNSDMRRVYAYLLKQRFIDRDVINYFTNNKMLYEDLEFHNAVFVGFDENGIPRHAHKRGTYGMSSYKGNIESSNVNYSFHHIGRRVAADKSHTKFADEQQQSDLRPSNCLYVFEAPIDMLSFISLNKENWMEHSYVALCCVGVKALEYQLKANPNLTHVFLCLDNDKAGQESNMRIAKMLENVQVSFLIPDKKDWNEDLISLKTQEMEESPCQGLAL